MAIGKDSTTITVIVKKTEKERLQRLADKEKRSLSGFLSSKMDELITQHEIKYNLPAIKEEK
ncbi:hypothetical protein N5N09_002888 [Listeria monocytogenes]|uniref:hypothetical protein n=1 Tax=Listeria TaxID=1637 RepID=UPI0010B6914D|nr:MULTISPECIES: hypothetical protein [Listeria]ECQ6354665.1 hypothetical protein [Listeria innocua]EAE0719581.1 hypothetical protein [Listeria monocytogenes]EAE3417559.1 hypothetical protein [Listeria monocytogenes]EAE3853762.1 hypothetical protein [Listeria monocytogenes]EAE4109011.1 hypothetical protein [Listeria monocytogenes]